jgi:hypothetical protein
MTLEQKQIYSFDFLFDADANTTFRKNYTLEDMERKAEEEDVEEFEAKEGLRGVLRKQPKF